MNKTRSRLRNWGLLLLGIACIGVFIFFLAPWIQDRFAVLGQIAQVAEERDIDPGAYFYSETEASYDSEQFLREAVRLGAPGLAGPVLSIASCILLCVIILWSGYRLPPR